MGYLPKEESEKRIAKVREIMDARGVDVALVYYDEFNIGNGWYLTGWCPQFESGAVLVPKKGEPMLLGGPESEPFARLDSAITETRNFPVFMVPDEEYPNATIIDFPKLFGELNRMFGSVKRVGLVGGGRMPADCHRQIAEGFKGVQLLDLTAEYVSLRFVKSQWERQQIRQAFQIADACYDVMKNKIASGVSEIQVAAEGEYAARSRGASGFGFSAIVGSGPRSNAVVPTASSRKMQAGELVMIGLAPRSTDMPALSATFWPSRANLRPRKRNAPSTFARLSFSPRRSLPRAKSARRSTRPPARISLGRACRNTWSARSLTRLGFTRPNRPSSDPPAPTNSGRA